MRATSPSPGPARGAALLLSSLRDRAPLIHNITNYVVMNVTANALLSIGASPVMAHAEEEAEAMAGLADALVLNIGTLSRHWTRAMLLAGRAARARGIPIALDPVGAGATRLRTATALHLLRETRPAILRANASELLALCGAEGATRGVDSSRPVSSARGAADDLARRTGTAVAVTGAEDYVTDGRRRARIGNGHPLMGRVTGSGCAATALVAAFCAVAPDPWTGATAALAVYGLAGERAAAGNPGPGTFQVRLLDALDAIRPEDVEAGARIRVSGRGPATTRA